MMKQAVSQADVPEGEPMSTSEETEVLDPHSLHEAVRVVQGHVGT